MNLQRSALFKPTVLMALALMKKTLIKKMAASSIESIYIVIGYPGPIQQPIMTPVAAWEKMVDRPISTVRESLGIQHNTHTLTLDAPDRKVKKIYDIIQDTWGIKRKVFTVIDAAILIGNIIHALTYCSWLQWAAFNLQDALKTQLRSNAKRLARSKHFKELFSTFDEDWHRAPRNIQKLKILKSDFVRKVWHCKEKTVITKDIRKEIDWIKKQCSDHIHGIKKWYRPISHYIDREPDSIFRHDASIIYGAAGFSPTLQVYWQIKWTDIHPDLPKYFLNANPSPEKLISINVLEFIAKLTNIFCAAFCYTLEEYKLKWQPRVEWQGDNQTTNTWSKSSKATTRQARRASKAIGFIYKHTDIGGTHPHIPGKNNWFADALSRTELENIKKYFSHLSNSEIFSHFQQDPTSTKITFKRFHPSAEVLSTLQSILLLEEPQLQLPRDAKKWGRIAHDETISFDMSPTSWDCKIQP